MPKDVWALNSRLIGKCECLVHWGGVLWHSTEQLALVWVHNAETMNLLAIVGHWTTVGDETFVPHKQYDFVWLKSLFCVWTVFFFARCQNLWYFDFSLWHLEKSRTYQTWLETLVTQEPAWWAELEHHKFCSHLKLDFGANCDRAPPPECQKVPKSEEIWGNTWKLNKSPSTLHRVTLYRYLSWDTETRVSQLNNGQHRFKSFKRRQIGSASPEWGSSCIKVTFSQRRPSTLTFHIGCCGAAAQAAQT